MVRSKVIGISLWGWEQISLGKPDKSIATQTGRQTLLFLELYRLHRRLFRKDHSANRRLILLWKLQRPNNFFLINTHRSLSFDWSSTRHVSSFFSFLFCHVFNLLLQYWSVRHKKCDPIRWWIWIFSFPKQSFPLAWPNEARPCPGNKVGVYMVSSMLFRSFFFRIIRKWVDKFLCLFWVCRIIKNK